MTPNEYQAKAMETQADQEAILFRLYGDGRYGVRAMQLDNAARGLSDEAGEISSCVKKWIEYGKPLDVGNLKEEVGDCLWRLAQVCDAAGFSLQEAMEGNIHKLQKVRYKGGYTEEKAGEEARDRTAERAAVEMCAMTAPELKSGTDTPETPTLDTCSRCGATGAYFHEKHSTFRCKNCYHAWQIPVVKEPVASFGDGLRKRPTLSQSYDRFCEVCRRNPIHRTNKLGLCPQCAAEKRARDAELKARVQTGAGWSEPPHGDAD